MDGHSQDGMWEFLGLGCLGFLVAIIVNLALLAGGVWVVVKILQSMGVI